VHNVMYSACSIFGISVSNVMYSACMLPMILFQLMNCLWLRFCVTIVHDKHQTWVFLFIWCAKVALYMVEACLHPNFFLIRIIQKSYVTSNSWRPWCIFCLFNQLLAKMVFFTRAHTQKKCFLQGIFQSCGIQLHFCGAF